MVHVKICGLRTAGDAADAVSLGASAIGLNFVGASPRLVDAARAREIGRAARALGSPVMVVGVVADMSVEAMRALVREAELDCLQLHGDEPEETVSALLPHAYKAVRIATAGDVDRARRYPGEHILVDAKVEGALGGTGETFDWDLVGALARERKVTLAGGLHAGNVAAAVRAIRPYCVDVASGVERAPGEKDRDKVRAFMDAVRNATGGS
jgi:phosphoribosylanthranilate isomerase